MYPYEKDKDCEDDSVYKPLSKYGVSKQRWKRWIDYKFNYIANILNVEEQKKLVSDYTTQKEINNPINLFESVCLFYKSASFKSEINYPLTLNQQNYWFWRQHFIKHEPIRIVEEDPYSTRVEIPLNHAEWWKYQIVDDDGKFLHVFGETESDEEDDNDESNDDDFDDDDFDDDDFGTQNNNHNTNHHQYNEFNDDLMLLIDSHFDDDDFDENNNNDNNNYHDNDDDDFDEFWQRQNNNNNDISDNAPSSDNIYNNEEEKELSPIDDGIYIYS